MMQRVRGRRWIATGITCVVFGAAAWLAWPHLKLKSAAKPDELAALTQRCQVAMLRDVCGVMKGSAPQASQGRLFIAGLGEVDAQAFSRLRAAGDTMCQDVAAQCQADWAGQTCKIARALYPELVLPQ
jgi:hypothetical protein